jgi:hypothetical protein
LANNKSKTKTKYEQHIPSAFGLSCPAGHCERNKADDPTEGNLKVLFLLNLLYISLSFTEVNQKYSVDTIPKTANKYQVEINYMNDGQWTTAHTKSTDMQYQNLNIHKLASASSTYSICFTNLDQELLRLSVNIQSGL